MRSEKEMMDMILHVATEDERVRAVGMNGSRTNPNAPKDPFQDYDIVYLVTDMQSFIEGLDWIDVFGERIIMQTPENMDLFPAELGGRFSYLMLFADGNRIDLTLAPIEEKEQYCREDKLTIILLDKDNILPDIPAPTDADYWTKRPTEAFFADCCNEFWWVTTYVAKGLWRNEILYAQAHVTIVRNMLIQMLEWQAGIKTDFAASIGKNGKYLEKYLSENAWSKLLETYPTGSYKSVWHALFTMCDLFIETANNVADTLQFAYPTKEEQRVLSYLKHIRNLPADARDIY